MNQKGEIDLTQLAMGIVVLGVIVGIGSTILANIQSSQIENLGTHNIANETVTSVTLTSKSLANYLITGVSCYTNATGMDAGVGAGSNKCLEIGNFTTDLDKGLIAISSSAGATNFSGESVNVTYTYRNYTDPRYKLPGNASAGLGEYGNWFKIIVIVGIAAVVLSLIFLAFGRGKSASTSVSY